MIICGSRHERQELVASKLISARSTQHVVSIVDHFDTIDGLIAQGRIPRGGCWRARSSLTFEHRFMLSGNRPVVFE